MPHPSSHLSAFSTSPPTGPSPHSATTSHRSLFAFHRRTLAGVLVRVGGEWQLFANALATDHASLRASHLYAIARDHQALIDPADPSTRDPDDYVIEPRQHGEADRSILARLAAQYQLRNPKVWPVQRHRIIGKFPSQSRQA